MFNKVVKISERKKKWQNIKKTPWKSIFLLVICFMNKITILHSTFLVVKFDQCHPQFVSPNNIPKNRKCYLEHPTIC